MFPHPCTECNVESVLKKVIELGRWLTAAAADGTAEHEVERHVFTQILAMGGKLLGEFLTSVGPGDLGPAVTLDNGDVVKRLPEQSRRRLVTVFGAFAIPRFVYGSRPGQKIELTPTDQRLQLPDGEMSYLLQDWNQRMSVEQPFGTVARSLETILGLKQSVDTLEHGNRQMAEAAGAFRAAQPRPDPEAEGVKVLLISEGKHELEGSLRTLVQRLSPELDEIEQIKVTHPALRTHGGTGHGYFKKAVRCMLYAQEQAYEAVVLVIDQDDEPERRRELSKAQDHALATIRRALGVAIRTFDAWMLADEKALSHMLGMTIQRQPDPESIVDAKSICRGLLASSDRELSQTDFYAELAGVTRLDELERRCPDGFGVFATRIRAI